jgi:hypothetical protein
LVDVEGFVGVFGGGEFKKRFLGVFRAASADKPPV